MSAAVWSVAEVERQRLAALGGLLRSILSDLFTGSAPERRDPKHRRLADAIRADEANFLAFVQSRGSFDKEDLVAVLFEDVVEADHAGTWEEGNTRAGYSRLETNVCGSRQRRFPEFGHAAYIGGKKSMAGGGLMTPSLEEGQVPTIAYFLGISVRMFFNDHDPPHFHVTYHGYRARSSRSGRRCATRN